MGVFEAQIAYTVNCVVFTKLHEWRIGWACRHDLPKLLAVDTRKVGNSESLRHGCNGGHTHEVVDELGGVTGTECTKIGKSQETHNF